MVFEVRRASDGQLAMPVFSTKGLVGDIGGVARGVWHGITSLF